MELRNARESGSRVVHASLRGLTQVLGFFINESFRRWEDFLNPDFFRTELFFASIYLAAFEILKGLIIQRIETFFTDGFGPQGYTLSPEYEVVSGPILMLQLMLEIALGEPEKAPYYYDEFRRWPYKP